MKYRLVSLLLTTAVLLFQSGCLFSESYSVAPLGNSSGESQSSSEELPEGEYPSSFDPDDWGFEADMENVETMDVDIYYTDGRGAVLKDDNDEPVVAEDTIVEYIPVPFYVDHHFIGEGWMGAGSKEGYMNLHRDCEIGPVDRKGGYIEDSEELEEGDSYKPNINLCKHYVFKPDYDDDDVVTNWVGVAWLWNSNWGLEPTELIRIGPGARKISFWAKSARASKTVYNSDESGLWYLTEPDNSTTSREHNHSIGIGVCGNRGGQCDWDPMSMEFVVSLSDKWEYFELPLPEKTYVTYQDMFQMDTLTVIDRDFPHLVSFGFMWTNAQYDTPEGDSLDFYIDRIRYSDEPLYGGTPGIYETTITGYDITRQLSE
ncbi:MAG: hypothetical protein OCD01_03875 [Fibrobacterales bacterium]